MDQRSRRKGDACRRHSCIWVKYSVSSPPVRPSARLKRRPATHGDARRSSDVAGVAGADFAADPDRAASNGNRLAASSAARRRRRRRCTGPSTASALGRLAPSPSARTSHSLDAVSSSSMKARKSPRAVLQAGIAGDRDVGGRAMHIDDLERQLGAQAHRPALRALGTTSLSATMIRTVASGGHGHARRASAASSPVPAADRCRRRHRCGSRGSCR